MQANRSVAKEDKGGQKYGDERRIVTIFLKLLIILSKELRLIKCKVDLTVFSAVFY